MVAKKRSTGGGGSIAKDASVRYIGQNTSDSHQTSPHWLLTFIRFKNRDTQNYEGSNKEFERTRKPLIVENDCVTLSVSTSKTNTTPSATMVLLSGDINYATAISPGDFVIINMVNFSEKARELRVRAGQELPINRVGDGFKGVFKINSVNKIIQTDPASAMKTVRYQITAYGFTEFNNQIYYNPTLGKSVSDNVMTYFIGQELLSVISSKKEIQEALEILPNKILGGGRISEVNDNVKKTPYIVPKSVFSLLGIKNGGFAIDLYKIMIGAWNDISKFNPRTTTSGQIQTTSYSLQGKIPIQTSSLTNVRLTDVLKRFSNELINEMYMCYRVDEASKKILPKLIIRQKPFNSEHGVKKDGNYEQITGTKFLSLPRWKISSDLIYNLNISKNESLRFNFVHIIGTVGIPGFDKTILATQNAKNSTVVFDKTDVERHGLRPYTKVSNFDWTTVDGKSGGVSYAPYWAKLVFDWVNGGHLKTNGTVGAYGIEEDICIGDNLELQDTVYHIEAIDHIGAMSPDGKKTFRTNLTLSHGIDKRSSSAGPVYPEMDYTDTFLDRKHDYTEDYGIMPGFSDTQDILGREGGEEIKETRNGSFTPAKLRKKSKNDGNN